MTDTISVFEAHAESYERERRRLIPPFDAFYGTAVEALGIAGRPLHRVLDLGAGTGLLARRIAAAYEDAQLTLLDGSPAMLERARSALGARASYVSGDLADPLPEGPWDAVVSALAIHHLGDDAKADLFARVHAALMPGGMFINAEQVAAPTGLFADAYAAWHEEGARRCGATDEEWQASVLRMGQDRTATVERHLIWMREAGFADADCLFKDRCFAVLCARRAG